MKQLSFDFDALAVASKPDRQQEAPARKILPFPLARHTRSAVRLGCELRPLSQAEREKIWGQRTGQLIRARIAVGLSTEAAIADVSAWAVFARAALYNPLPERPVPKKQLCNSNVVFPDFSKQCRAAVDNEPPQSVAEG